MLFTLLWCSAGTRHVSVRLEPMDGYKNQRIELCKREPWMQTIEAQNHQITFSVVLCVVKMLTSPMRLKNEVLSCVEHQVSATCLVQELWKPDAAQKGAIGKLNSTDHVRQVLCRHSCWHLHRRSLDWLHHRLSRRTCSKQPWVSCCLLIFPLQGWTPNCFQRFDLQLQKHIKSVGWTWGDGNR